MGRVPGFELAGYDRSFLDAFSGRRREILARLETLGLPCTPELAQMAALHTRRRKKDVGLAELVPAWREKARALGLAREQAALVPPRPIHPLTWERVEVPRVPPPDLPANAIRSMKRAPALPTLPGDGAGGVVGNGRRPPARAGGAVAGAGAGRPGGRGAGGGARGGAADGDPGGRDPRGGAGPRAGALHALPRSTRRSTGWSGAAS